MLFVHFLNQYFDYPVIILISKKKTEEITIVVTILIIAQINYATKVGYLQILPRYILEFVLKLRTGHHHNRRHTGRSFH